MRFRPLTLCVIACGALAPAALADLAQVAASHDNTLYQDANGGLSNGAGNGFFVGANAGGAIRRGLISFDIAGSVPAGATVTGAVLKLHVSSAQAPAATIGLHPALASWGEGASDAGAAGGSGASAASGDATWLHRFFNTTAWTTPGGDFNPVASASTSVTGVANYTWSSAAMAADVQGWLASPGTNYGWLLMGGEATASSAKKFDSREAATASFRPVLEVTYTPVPGPSALALLGFAGLGVSRRRR